MTRRRSVRQDSLELLLDTICNTFGGVLFIAILVVLLLQQAGGGNVEPLIAEIAEDELMAQSQHLTSLINELTRLRANSESQLATVSRFASDETQELIAQKKDLESQRDRLQAQVDALLLENAKRAADVGKIEADNREVQKNLEKAKSAKRDAETQLDADRKTRVTEARLPQVRSKDFKREIGFIVQYDRLYLWHEYDSVNDRVGLNTRDFVIVGEESGGLVTTPKPSGGIPLDESEFSKSAVRRLLRQFDPSRCYLSPIVRPDSFDSFQYFRDQALELGFNYRLMPVAPGSAVYDRGGLGTGVQ